MAIILNGKKIANKILADLKRETKKLAPIKLAVVLVEDDPASLSFIKQKQKATEKIGVGFELYKFNKNIEEQKLIEEVKKIAEDQAITGLVIQLPLPSHINVRKIVNLIPPKKDVDGLSVNKLVESPAASGIIKMLEEYNIQVKGKKVVIIGRGELVGKPLAQLIKKTGGDLTICDIKTRDLKSKTLKADILISAAGSPGLIKENMVKKGAVVINAGFAQINNKIVGDINFENVKKKASHITPVVGGVGPVTVAMLMTNLIQLTKI